MVNEMDKRNAPPTDSEPILRTPHRDELEMFGIVTKLLGGTHVQVMCEDKIQRTCRIPGKLKKKIWMIQGDIVIVKLWDFQRIKADVVWRFLPLQVQRLRNKGFLKQMDS